MLIVYQSALSSLESRQSQNKIPFESVNITLGVNVLGKTLFSAFSPPLGGVNITNPDTGGGCTLGLPVLVDNVPSYLTAGHCSKTWGAPATRVGDGGGIQQGGVTIGTESFDVASYSCPPPNLYYKCFDADISIYGAVGNFSRGRIIKTNGGIRSRDTGTVDTYYDVTTISERPGTGVVISNIGGTSGYHEAKIISSDTDLVYEGITTVIKRTVEVRQEPTTGVAAGCEGDSGSPWFQITGTNTAKFLGIYTGQSTDAPSITRPDGAVGRCGWNAYFSPIAQIRTAFPNKAFTFTR